MLAVVPRQLRELAVLSPSVLPWLCCASVDGQAFWQRKDCSYTPSFRPVSVLAAAFVQSTQSRFLTTNILIHNKIR